MSYEHLALVFLAFALGGVLKGAIGAGAPILAVPLMAILVDVPFAVAVFLVPNIVSNSIQVWRFRLRFPPGWFVVKYALSGMVGAGVGTLALRGLSSDALSVAVALVVLAYIAFRLARPGWRLGLPIAERLAMPVGVVSGVLQGATGLSAPISVTFVNAIQLDRESFIPTMSLFFAGMAVVQFPTQVVLGIMTPERFLYSIVATLPLVGFMPVGGFLARHLPRQVFDRVILGLLFLLALRLLWRSLT